MVIGAHYADVTPTNQAGLSRAAAKGIVDRDIGAAGERLVDLMINPVSGRYFYRVETRRADSRWVHWIDAGNGQVLNKYDAIAYDCGTPPCGFGVAYADGDATDVKDLTGLTTLSGSEYLLLSARQETHDQGSQRRPHLGPVATDADDLWVLLGDVSPAQPALVDGHYYAYVTDEYFMDVFGYDWVAAGSAATGGDIQKMVIHAHYKYQYANAFWNGSYVALGDGDQIEFRELTTMDILAHELSHAVTDFTSDLIYQDEPGALNEAFSDIMAVNAEFYAEANGLEPATTLAPDWLVGEDLDLRSDDAEPGFRNMGDPEEDGDPDHYTERYVGSDDNGGVHSNSGIANHAYYLLVNGGLNASCASPGDHNSAHCTDGDQDDNLSVTAISLADAEQIFFLGFTGLAEDASMCDARTATETAATSLFGSASQELQSTTDAWIAVGLTDALCGGSGNLPPTASFTFTCTDLTCDFDASASYDSDGSITNYAWDFGDGETGSGVTASHTYDADGNYTVTLTVTDDDAATDDDVQVVSVGSGGDDTMHVAAIDMWYTRTGRNYTVNTRVTIKDANNSPVSGATVSLQMTLPSGSTASGSADTDSDGTVTFSLMSKQTGTYTSEVTNVTHASLIYEPGANVETSESLAVP
jgi:Zn-dependent metalloprotease